MIQSQSSASLFTQAIALAIAIWSCSNPLNAVANSAGSSTTRILDGGDPAGEQGWAVDISGDLAIVGAPFYEGGSAFIFDLTTGTLLHRLTASDSNANDLFGFSVAINGGLAVVASGQRNAAYIFDTSTGQQLRRLAPTSRDFVRSVDISNGIAVLGTPTVEFGGAYTTDYGAAFLYDAVTGAQIKRINGPTTFNKRGFGSSVAVDGDTVAIISPSYGGRDDVYVLDASTGAGRWTYGNSTIGGQFNARDVVIDGERIVVGGGSPSFGMPTAYVFDRTSGTLIREMDIRVDNPGDDYRNTLDVSGNRLIVGAWGTHDAAGYYTGAVHSFDVSTGEFLKTFRNPHQAPGDYFGFSVALEKERLIVGAPGTSSNLGQAGLTYLVFVPEPSTFTLASIAVLSHLGHSRRLKRSRL